MPNFRCALTLRQIQNTLEDKESHNETKKQLEGCPLRVEELNQPGHLLIEVTDLLPPFQIISLFDFFGSERIKMPKRRVNWANSKFLCNN